MISLFSIPKIISSIATLYALSVLIILIFFNISGVATLSVAFKGAVVLDFLLIGISSFGWRWLWRKIPKLNDWIYPDLNGKWDVDIQWNWNDNSGSKPALAYIKQSLFNFSIELQSDVSESETLVVLPHKQPKSDRPGLYYIYRNQGKAGAVPRQAAHIGAAILNLNSESNDLLHGNYFTDRSTNGQYTLRRNNEI